MAHRTPATTTFGVLSVALGVFYTVMSVFMFLGGPGTGGAAEAAGTSGGSATMIWLGSLVASILMLLSGIGTLKATTWNRTVTMAFCGLGMVAFGAWLFTTWFGILPAIAVMYTVVVGATFFSTAGKASGSAMGTSSTSSTSASTSTTDQDKAAA